MGELDLTLGAVELGVIVATMLYGMALVQGYSYAFRCAQDPRWIQIIVIFLGLCETAHSALMWAYLYGVTVSLANPIVRLTNLPWTFDASIALSGIIGGTTQMFFTFRFYRISRHAALAVPAWLAALARVGISGAVTVIALKEPSILELRARYDALVYAALGVSAAVDIWNSAVLCYYLKTRRSDGGTRGAVNSIVLWSIETGLATTASAVAVLVCWTTMPDNYIWLGLFFVYSKLYSNTLLISLNSRERLRVAVNVLEGVTITRTLDISTAPPALHVSTPLHYRPHDVDSDSDVDDKVKPAVMYGHAV